MAELHLVSSGTIPIERFVHIASKVNPYVDYVHLREPSLSARELWETTVYMQDQGIPLSKIIINDRVDVAIAMGAGGVHLGHRSLPIHVVRRLLNTHMSLNSEAGNTSQPLPAIKLGSSVHSMDSAMASEREGVDYLFYGHIYSSFSKPNLEPRGLEQLTDVAKLTSRPIIAIGGIRPSHIPDVMRTGISGIAVISGILSSPDPLEAARQYRTMLDREGVATCIDP
ncbi:thiamine phosphate synthase [Paenibacillus sp. N1-5-1-14]|uniref:thiamine phosphate synthase n=1 Tax=Paenibacillus radicibacter TaxID=2972488 RepID=UPI00215986CB|nr:thiamine phosphate synthase [Paenibacillus radicibacter]MCR8644979.1 thiamine phosphate synthase [Paenibacillus radicibacter]